LQGDTTCLSAIGRALIEAGFSLDLDAMRIDVLKIRDAIAAKMPSFNDEAQKRMAPRLIFNRAVIIHSLSMLQRVLAKFFDDEFDADIAELLGGTEHLGDSDRLMQAHGMSEISKVISRLALLSREVDALHEMRAAKDYYVGDGWIEVKVERSYDQYRRYCASINDTPLFDNLESYWFALNAYSCTIDPICAASALRADGSSERIVRMSLRRLNREGVQSFRI